MTRIPSAATPIAFVLAFLALASPGVSCAQTSDDSPGEASPLVVMADFNRDGILDLAQVTAPEKDPSRPPILTVMLGSKDGKFQPATSTPALGMHPAVLAVGDFNRDGNPDLIVGDAGGSVLLFLGDGKGNLAPAGEIARVSSIASIAVGDFNRDGILDLVISDPRSNTATILFGDGHGAFLRAWSFTLPMQGVAYHLAAADFNGDGIPDLAVTNDDQDTFEVLLGNGNGTFTRAPELSHLRDPNSHCAT
jgi:hypothetical protein